MPHDADQHPGSDFYLGRLLPDDRDAFRAASPDADLSHEIRLLRAILSHLAEDFSSNGRILAQMLGLLVRAVSLQSRLADGPSDLSAVLRDAARDVLEGNGDD
ncbi:MAG TPA: hypothetical protein VFB58_01140 [Chloroflexota bacterium]|nr:hypothetical protein [Chloroflexota bacterium]